MALVELPVNTVTQKAIGAAIEVHRHLGPGLLESSYHTCLCRELELREIPFQSQVALPLDYKGVTLPRSYVIDLVIADTLIVEVKSVEALQPVHSAQIMTYMRLMSIQCGLLLNFNVTILPHGIRRVLLSV
ncbi:MAG: GxxExxY protein [Gemmatimonadetes bacterium]|nr:GxxExxY protein [Gemmatimonadota bacterium]